MTATTTMRPYKARKSAALKGRVRVPGDKSISHRALILGGLSTGSTRIEGLLRSEDVRATAAAIAALGVPVREQDGVHYVDGRGTGGFQQPQAPLDFGNSGTGARLMMGAVAGHDMAVSFTGDASLSARPMARVLTPLREMGINVSPPHAATLPLTISGTRRLLPIRYRSPVASAQVKSAILLAGLHAAGETTVIEPQPTRDHTERMVRFFGGEVREEDTEQGRAITIRGQVELAGREVVVPGDPSSAAFLVAAALMVPGSELQVEGVLVNPARIGFYQTLQEMGADLRLENARESGGEPVADIHVRAPAEGQGLVAVEVPAERVPSMVDEYPVLAVLAATARGQTRMCGLSELRFKESDRLAATATGLAANGVPVNIDEDDLLVTGGEKVPGGARVETDLDHRIAMAFLTLGLAAEAPVTVDDISMIDTSFPEYVSLMRGLGAQLEAV